MALAWDRRSERDPRSRPKHVEIRRSEAHGFVLMGHVEQPDMVSPPHDHGSGWVIYAVVRGRNEMGIFNRVVDGSGALHGVQKDSYVMEPGDCRVFLPGDIHDTLSLTEDTVMLRFTSCDFFEELRTGRLVRYTNYDKWIAA